MARTEISRLAIASGRPESTVARDLLALGKPHLTLLSSLTGAVGLGLPAGPPAPLATALATLLGLALLVGGAQALNQFLERDLDALMERTRGRPLPDGRLEPRTALVLGVVSSGLALALLGVFTSLLTVTLGAIALILYVLVYTPLKRVTPHALLVGAAAGAMPALLGSSAATGALGLPGLALYSVIALWQVPHFISIALFRRDDYARAGIRTIVGVYGEAVARRQAFLHCGWLLVAGLLLPASAAAGLFTLIAALAAGGAMWVAALTGLRPHVDAGWARRFFRLSLVYLPVLLVAVGVDRVLR